MSSHMQLPLEDDFFERFSISTLVFRGFEPVCKKSLTAIAEAGFRGIELLESPDQFDLANKESISLVASNCNDLDLSIFTFHAHYLDFDDVNSQATLQKKLDICYRQIDVLEYFGGLFWACHLHQIDAFGMKALEHLARYIENRPIKIGVENFVGRGMWVEDRLSSLKQLDAPKIGLLLDIGHVRNERGANPMTLPGYARQIILSTQPYLYHLHLHGFVGGVDHYPPHCPADTIQWREVMATLQEINYRGLYNFEPKGKPKHNDSIHLAAEFYSTMNSLP